MKTFIIIIIFIIMFMIFIIVESARELKKIKVVSYDVESEKIPHSFNGKKAVFFSDYHNSKNGRDNQLIIDKISNVKPDFIFVGGDMIVGKKGEAVSGAIDLLNRLAEEYPIYYVIGNHEKRIEKNKEIYGNMWDEYFEKLNKKIHYLRDDKLELNISDDKINLYGLDIGRWFYKRFSIKVMDVSYLNSKLGKTDASAFNLLLAHNPDYFPVYADWGADLTLSGHVHGGIVRLPFVGGVISPRLVLFPRYDRGVYVEKDKKMILSSGIGQHSIKIRINNIPEIVLINFISK